MEKGKLDHSLMFTVRCEQKFLDGLDGLDNDEIVSCMEQNQEYLQAQKHQIYERLSVGLDALKMLRRGLLAYQYVLLAHKNDRPEFIEEYLDLYSMLRVVQNKVTSFANQL